MTYPHPGVDAWESYKEENPMELKVLFFWAPWCAPCKLMSPGFDDASKANPNIKFEKINVDQDDATPNRYGVYVIPSICFCINGLLYHTHIGIMTESSINDEIMKMKKEIESG